MQLHHYRPQTAPITSTTSAPLLQSVSRGAISRPTWQHSQPIQQNTATTRTHSLWTCVLALMRRPLLIATLALVVILGVGTINEALVTAHISAQVQETTQQNQRTRAKIQQIQAQTISSSSDATIITEAQKLGYYTP